MNSRPGHTESDTSEQDALAKMKQNIPVQITDIATFDNGYAFMKERFHREMKRIEQQMNKFSSDLSHLYGEPSTVVQTNVRGNTPQSQTTAITKTDWDVLKTSPLVVGKGEDQCLKLQFDVSQFDPTEINVKLLNQMLIVSASHEEKSSDSTVYHEYSRQFKLPPGTDPEMVVSTLSRDGVLTVVAPLPLQMPTDHDASSYFSEP